MKNDYAGYFEALSQDFRYQLTCIGGFSNVYLAEKITDNHFRIAGGNPGLEVSWQITGIRKDAWANARSNHLWWVARAMEHAINKSVGQVAPQVLPDIWWPREMNSSRNLLRSHPDLHPSLFSVCSSFPDG